MICSTSKTVEVSMAAAPGTAGAMLRNASMLGWMDVLIKDGSCVVKTVGSYAAIADHLGAGSTKARDQSAEASETVRRSSCPRMCEG